MFAPSTQALPSASKALNADSYRQRIDERLSELQNEMRALKTCRNSLSSFMNLPPEILSAIFVLVYFDHEGQPPHRGEKWIWMMHVCAHWRGVAFGCADIWTSPTFSKPALTNYQLSRAGQAPLRIYYAPSLHNGLGIPEIGSGILSQTECLRSINIEISSGQRPHLLQALEKCSGPAPYLQSVRVCDNSLYGGFQIPSQFLAGGAPALQSLELHACHIATWNAPPFIPNLTHLKLTAKLRANSVRPSWGNLLQLLEQMPLLQTLHLADFLPLSDWSLESPQFREEARSTLTFR